MQNKTKKKKKVKIFWSKAAGLLSWRRFAYSAHEECVTLWPAFWLWSMFQAVKRVWAVDVCRLSRITKGINIMSLWSRITTSGYEKMDAGTAGRIMSLWKTALRKSSFSRLAYIKNIMADSSGFQQSFIWPWMPPAAFLGLLPINIMWKYCLATCPCSCSLL